jgi:hypothetical protein
LGEPFYGIHIAIWPLEGAQPLALPEAISSVARLAFACVGVPIAIASGLGLVVELANVVRGRISGSRAAYALLTVVVWLMILSSSRSLGPGLYSRYLLFGLTAALPFAVVLPLEVFGRSRSVLAASALVILVSLGIAFQGDTWEWVTRQTPTDIVGIARWLPNTPYRSDAVLMTKMDWQSTYLPLYAPQLSDHSLIVSVWIDDATLRRFVKEERPTLLITRREDESYRERIAQITGRSITPDRCVYRDGLTEVFDITEHPSSNRPKPK